MSFHPSLGLSQRAAGSPSIKLGLKKLRDEYAGLDRLDRPELDEEDVVPAEPMTDSRRVA